MYMIFSLQLLLFQTADLFHFCVKTLQHFLPKSSDSKDSEKRTEEFEYVLQYDRKYI
jgi:hypothetical protein